jgi:[ribosomal protein S18]-alanine N-acetyltransferase
MLLASHPRCSLTVARVIRLTGMTAVVSAGRLLCLVLLGRPRGLHYVVAETGAAETGSAVAGYGCIKTTGVEAAIDSLAVRSNRRHRGVGSALLGELTDRARSGGCHAVTLYVRADNAEARQLYEHRGFAEADVLPGYYRPSTTDAIVMRLELA